ncbi:MAG: tRNA-(ms[2]io[6]A)-hydroxylase [Planctomycetes bacterium]|nr:tRNA-(ms[2]io[6]A)-hydroxylase [Planctomycetota bacterium]
MTRKTVELPLRYRTPDAWAVSALADPLALLNDHAHLEKKAAANALELLNQWPDPTPPEYWVECMTAIARDEVEHLAIVTRLLARRGGRLTKQHRNAYASALRERVRKGQGPREVLDRLIVSALIEARSCERFELLSRHVDDRELSKLYAGLWASEHGHFRVFLDLAMKLPEVAGRGARLAVESCWSDWLDFEAKLIAAQPPGPRMHSGV